MQVQTSSSDLIIRERKFAYPVNEFPFKLKVALSWSTSPLDAKDTSDVIRMACSQKGSMHAQIFFAPLKLHTSEDAYVLNKV